MRERIRKWLFPTFDEQLATLKARIAELESHELPAEVTEAKRDPIKQPFRVNRVPGRKLRAEQEWKHSPEYKQDIAKKQEVKALQPKGK